MKHSHKLEFLQPSATCRDLKKLGPGAELSLAGFAHTIRDHGEVVFLDLRDMFGTCQLVFSPEFSQNALDVAKHLRTESTIWIKGRIRVRPEGTENPAQEYGDIEIVVIDAKLLSRAEVLPFPLDTESEVGEPTLLKFRFLHLRTERLQKNLHARFELVKNLRDAFYNDDFIEVETPLLFKATPEGARDFLVPSRLHQGHFYALTQSPQMLKQLLMVGGMGRYIQLTKCFRDEDLRADRQPEFTQLDLEASFLTAECFMELVEKNVLDTFSKLKTIFDRKQIDSALWDDLPRSIDRIPYDDAMKLFGSDKPDLRFALPIHDATEILRATAFETFRSIVDQGGSVKYLCVGADVFAEDLPRNFLDELPAFAKQFGVRGLAWVRLQADGSWQGPAGKFFSDAEKVAMLKLARKECPYVKEQIGLASIGKEGTMLFFSASTDTRIAEKVMGALRLKLADVLRVAKKPLALAWITDWPLFEYDSKSKQGGAAHHPFTAPANGSISEFYAATRQTLSTRACEKIKAQAFDLVCNGSEIGGGSARIFNSEMQSHMFELLGLSEDDRTKQFGFFINALSYGTPPHVGMALGIDRIVALLVGEQSIRDVIAFPKTGTGSCLMSNCPTPVERRELRELGIHLRTEG